MLVTVLLPVLLVGAILVDLALFVAKRKRPIAVRLVLMLWWFLAGELRGIATLGFLWLRAGGRDTPGRRRGVYRLRQTWAAGHLGGVKVLFRLRFEIDGLEEAGSGPVLVMIRHASIVDNMLPDAVLGRANGVGLRFVIKRELQLLPTIDIGGRWVPTVFVRRASTDQAAELAKLRVLAEDLSADEGLLIYPEGTRSTTAKIARAQEIIRERQPEIAPLADRLRHLLPPRLGGPLALLDATRGTDVVFCGHVGFDGYERISDVWRGDLLGTTIKIKFWREPASSVPDDPDAATRWLYEHWQRMDDWIGAQLGTPAPAVPESV